MSHDAGNAGGYEKTDIDPIQILIYAAVLIVFLIISLILLDDYFIYKKEQFYREMVLEPENPQLLELRAKEDSILNSYGRLADSAVVEYHIPIDSAMKQVAAKAGGNK